MAMNPLSLQCSKCEVTVPTVRLYRHHWIRRHQNFLRNIPCPVCLHEYASWNSLYKHYKGVHFPKNNQPVEVSNVASEYDSFVSEIRSSSTPLLSPERVLSNSVSNVAAKYFGIQSMTNKATLSFISTMKSTASNVIDVVEASNVSAARQVVMETFEPFSSAYKAFGYFSKKKTLLQPVEYLVGLRKDFVGRGGNKKYKTVKCVAHRIPLRPLFERFFSLNKVLSSTLRYMQYLATSEKYENFAQGSFWKAESDIRRNGKIYLPFFLYFDDFEVGNPLSSRAGIHKLGGIYISFPTLAVDHPSGRFISSSSLNKILLVGLFHSIDRNNFGNLAIFSPIIAEINDLYNEGIDFLLDDYQGKVYFQMGLLVGDNLGLNSVSGFVESFSANRCCRTCRIEKCDLKKDLIERPDILRNVFNYENDLALDKSSLTGIKEKSIWFNLEGFNAIEQIAHDCMHDLNEGVCRYVMGFLIKALISLRYFTAEMLNDRLHSFDFGPDNSAKPVAMTADNIRKETIRQTASGMAVLIRYFGLLVGDCVPQDNPHWALYQSLHDVMTSVMARDSYNAECHAVLMEHQIRILCETYMSLSGCDLKPKFHFLLHYPRTFLRFGPLSRLSSMRFEGKHRPFKTSSNVCASRVNITKTLATKHQLSLNSLFVSGSFEDPLAIRFSKKKIDLEQYASYFEPIGIPCALDDFRLVLSLRYHEHLYKAGTIIASHLSPNDDFPQFLEIEMIVCTPLLDYVMFLGTPFITNYFDPHYVAHEVEKQQHKSVINFKNLLSLVCCNFTKAQNGNCYVKMR